MTQFKTSHHPREYPGFRYLYPVWSRRRSGISLGINLNPDKICNFHCVYCQVDRYIPGHENEVDAELVIQELTLILSKAQSGALSDLPGFDWLEKMREDGSDATTPACEILDVSFSGDGEPTTAKEFPELVPKVLKAVADAGLSIPVIVFTNATRVDRPPVCSALKRVLDSGGQVWAKLDAGTDAGLRRFDGVGISMRRIMENLVTLARCGPVTIQTMLCRDANGPIPLEEVQEIAARLQELEAAGGRVREVQVYTVARATPDEAVVALTAQELKERAKILREGQPFPVQAYGVA